MVDETIEETRCACFVVSECTKKCEDAHTALTSNTCTSGDVFAWLVLNVELEPFTTVRMHCALNKLMLREVT